MAKIILNPTNGAPISDIQIAGVRYFAEKSFEVGTMVKIEDDKAADVLLGIYEFLVFMSPEDAKSHREEMAKKKYPCKICSEVLMSEGSLAKHTAKHEEDEKLDKELGIEVVKAVKSDKVEEKKLSPQDAIDAQARAAGLDYGEGVRKE